MCTLRALFVRRFDLARRMLETVDEEAREAPDLPSHAQSEYSETQLEAYCRAARVVPRSDTSGHGGGHGGR